MYPWENQKEGKNPFQLVDSAAQRVLLSGEKILNRIYDEDFSKL